MPDFKLNSGEIPVTLGEDDLILRPTINAARIISRQYDGFAKAREALVGQNFDAVVFILRQGLGNSINDKDAKDLDQRVFRNGMTAELLIPLIRYVAVLGNGGRALPDEDEETGNTSGFSEGGDTSNPNS